MSESRRGPVKNRRHVKRKRESSPTCQDVRQEAATCLDPGEFSGQHGLHSVGASGTVGPTSLPEGAETPGRAPSECRVCKKSFPYQSQLTLHQRTHTAERPIQCDICAKGFIQLSDLRVHERIHTGEKPYSCDLCLKKFTHDSTLRTHKRTHTQEKPFRCEQCESFRPPRDPQCSPTHPLWAQALRVPRVSQCLPSTGDFQTPPENPVQMTGSGPCPPVQVPSAPRRKFGIICHLCDTKKG